MSEMQSDRIAPTVGAIVKNGYIKPQGLTPEQDPFDIDTTGWVVTQNGYARLTSDGVLCEVYQESSPDEGSWHWTSRVGGIDTAHGDLESCLYHASLKANLVGWAEQDGLANLIAEVSTLRSAICDIKKRIDESTYQVWTRDWGNDDVIAIDLILEIVENISDFSSQPKEAAQ